MIAYLRGQIQSMGDTWVILDVGGVGYRAACSRQTLSSLGGVGETATLYIETVLRQDSLQLFGFSTASEKDIFLTLTTVQGVGMRVGLALLSILSPDEVVQAIAAQDKAVITRAEGVGPKLASRIISELKDKMPQVVVLPQATNQGGAVFHTGSMTITPVHEEAVSALVNLGYRRSEALQAISGAQRDLGEAAALSDLIRVGLTRMGRAS